MQPQPDQAVANRWTNVAQYWEKYRDTIRQLFAPVTQALIDDARIAPGHRVLDIATGPGEPAATIASHVAPHGRVAGIDLVPEMAAAACRAADRLGVGNAKFCAASALQLPFPADTFDALVSRFGVMFFPSPVDGVREMLRVLKPGRRLALAVWDFADVNPFFYTMSRAIEKYVASPPIDPDAPDAFRFATSGKLKRVLIDAGAHEPAERVLQFTIGAPISVEQYWTLRYEISETTRDKLAKLSAEQFGRCKAPVPRGDWRIFHNPGHQLPRSSPHRERKQLALTAPPQARRNGFGQMNTSVTGASDAGRLPSSTATITCT